MYYMLEPEELETLEDQYYTGLTAGTLGDTSSHEPRRVMLSVKTAAGKASGKRLT